MVPKRSRGGFQNRGGARGRGGHGRGGGRGGGKKFESSRLAALTSDSAEENELSLSEEEEESEAQESSGDESEDEPKRNPYLALMQNFAASATKPKRRKLNSAKQVAHGHPTAGSEGQEEVMADNQGDVDEDDISDGDEEESEDGVDVNELVEADDAFEGDGTDPFEAHFASPDMDVVGTKVKAIEGGEWRTVRSTTANSRVVTMFPGSSEGDSPQAFPSISSIEKLKLKERLKKPAAEHMPSLDMVQKELAPVVFNYQDVFYGQRTVKNSDGLRNLICLHALNHIFKTRDRVIKNNAKIVKEGPNADLELQDQGYRRPKVLFLLPTRNSCVRIIKTIAALAAAQEEKNKDRFTAEFVDTSTPFSADKPEDFKELFDGNDDDVFRLGMHFTRRTIKYFTPFYRSDILLASPLGLRLAIGAEDPTDRKNRNQKVDFDFLSSIEMVVVDQADALLMQNWAHLDFVFDHLNRVPNELGDDLDISRVRPWYLEGWQAHFRQTVVLSAFHTPEIAELLRRHCRNWAGKARFQAESHPGEIQRVLSSAVRATKQTFSRLDALSVARDPEARFAYFTAAVLPHLLRHAKDGGGGAGGSASGSGGGGGISGTLLFVPAYADFVRLRNFLATDLSASALSFASLHEHADVREASRARSHFQTGRVAVLLYTERAHHFWRYRVRGARRIIFYGLPDNPLFYSEIAGGFLASNQALQPGAGTVRVLFSKYDALKLERVVGSARVGRMLKERGDTFDFV